MEQQPRKQHPMFPFNTSFPPPLTGPERSLPVLMNTGNPQLFPWQPGPFIVNNFLLMLMFLGR